jgi:hypothetical protein
MSHGIAAYRGKYLKRLEKGCAEHAAASALSEQSWRSSSAVGRNRPLCFSKLTQPDRERAYNTMQMSVTEQG